ncbi:hypothetical protein SARC_04964 [Sphaeroforma arctica JP610]|uniref:Uncharacterized protein n=1 Tax=Sphaeroforma arctica JP610 TaxID=667725 RepID=A0A0L0G1P9_9EUKA|nr:hypothetical protein SARC_04964 [Sphaeroforma arctica JP610]KNC82764.1 hypothetical protein SARC_04964 [Sphaeroforma arctica JP610]|eukprot:XP_014156666.1 hypothetical protein SARC_04964 [Sphaeroforma arctica JP610]
MSKDYRRQQKIVTSRVHVFTENETARTVLEYLNIATSFYDTYTRLLAGNEGVQQYIALAAFAVPLLDFLNSVDNPNLLGGRYKEAIYKNLSELLEQIGRVDITDMTRVLGSLGLSDNSPSSARLLGHSGDSNPKPKQVARPHDDVRAPRKRPVSDTVPGDLGDSIQQPNEQSPARSHDDVRAPRKRPVSDTVPGDLNEVDDSQRRSKRYKNFGRNVIIKANP